MFAFLGAGAAAPALSCESRAGTWGVVRVDGVGVAPPVSRQWRARTQIAVLSRTHRRRVATRVATQLVKEMLARDAAAHRAMLIVGRFFTGRRARQRTACFGTKGLALLNNANIASTDRPACLIASAAYCRVSYSTGLASIASHGALIARLQSAPAPSISKSCGAAQASRPLSLGQTRAWTTPVGRCFLKKWRLGRCNFEQ